MRICVCVVFCFLCVLVCLCAFLFGGVCVSRRGGGVSRYKKHTCSHTARCVTQPQIVPRLCEIEHARSALLTSDVHKHMHDTAAVSHAVSLIV